MMSYWICKILHGVNEDALCYELDLMDIAYQPGQARAKPGILQKKR